MPADHDMMLIRGRFCSLAAYRRRRRQALRLLREHFQAEWPVLLVGYRLRDEFEVPSPLVGRMRQDPWFDYYTGCHEAGAALLLQPGARMVETLFLDPGDPDRVLWEGERLPPGPAARRAFGVQAVASAAELRAQVVDAAEIAGGNLIMLSRKREPGLQARAYKSWQARLRGCRVHNGEPVLVRQRMIKDAEEIAWHRKAVARTWAGLRQVLPQLSGMRNEAQVAGALTQHYIGDGFESLAFSTIVAGGRNAATLHYAHNDQPFSAKAGVLIDSGARAGGYCADVTRTLPKHGRFDQKRFRELYQLVLQANQLARQQLRPGMTLKELNELAWQPIIDAGFDRRHGLSHHIGLDVHDPADYQQPLAPGMIISNEPGIYLPEEGIGIRIEDDLLISQRGCQELTSQIPKEIAALEALLGRAAQSSEVGRRSLLQ